MRPRRVSICIFLFCSIFLITGAVARTPGVAPEKEIVTDGRYVHDVGELLHHVTNWGLLGSSFGVSTPFADSPSAMWPAWSGDEYLWGAGLWVGGVVLGEQLVTTGAWGSEWRPTAAVADTIWVTAHGAAGGVRYPWEGADDDGDGLEDEEMLNGLDDDGDGLVDEDFAAYGDQHFVCRYSDTDPELQELLPDHTPLNLLVEQQSIQWSSPLAEDFVGFDFRITNTGVVPIEDVYVGMFSDHDIGPRDLGAIAEDDMAGSWVGEVATAAGRFVPVQMSYMFDAAASPVGGYVGWVLCGHTTDPTGATAPVAPGLRTFQRFSGQAAFDQGGDPTNDTERYELMSCTADYWDPDVLPGHQADYRTLISSGPFASLAPGESISYQLALVVGDGLNQMLANAAEAVAACQGVNYDRDGDPANGEEFAAHWLLAEDAPVSAVTGRILASKVADGIELRIESNVSADEGLQVVRRAGADAAERTWSGLDLVETGISARMHSYRVLDTDRADGLRSYDLVVDEGGFTHPLDNVEMDLPAASSLSLEAGPNPFNPQLNVRFAVPAAGRVLLQAFDVRGHLVRTLVDEVFASGRSDVVVWRGDDDSGRALASGVYQLRLATEGELMEKRVTLVR